IGLVRQQRNYAAARNLVIVRHQNPFTIMGNGNATRFASCFFAGQPLMNRFALLFPLYHWQCCHHLRSAVDGTNFQTSSDLDEALPHPSNANAKPGGCLGPRESICVDSLALILDGYASSARSDREGNPRGRAA